MNGYYQVRFNLTFTEASQRIVAECQRFFEDLIANGSSKEEAEAARRIKVKELDDYWFTWVEYKPKKKGA